MIFRSDPAWHTARLGKLTASNMWRAMDRTQKGLSTAVRNQYMADVVAERMTDIIVPHPVNDAMQWGIDHQAEAISEFEIATGHIVGPEGLYIHSKIEDFVATPDGILTLGYRVILEVKCPMTATHIRYCETKIIPIKYQYQMAAQCLCASGIRGIFVSFDPRIKKSGRLLMLDFDPTQEFMEKVYEGAIQFLKDVDNLFEKVTTT